MAHPSPSYSTVMGPPRYPKLLGDDGARGLRWNDGGERGVLMCIGAILHDWLMAH